AILMILSGFILAVMALCLMNRQGRRGVFGPALAGVIINGLLAVTMLLAIPVLVKAHNRATAMANLDKAVREGREEAKKELRGEENVRTALERLDAVEKSIDAMARQSSGDDALALKASSAYLQRLQVISRNYATNLEALQVARVLDMSTVDRREQLESKRAVV